LNCPDMPDEEFLRRLLVLNLQQSSETVFV
jgi:hypothetical protein